RDAGGGACQSRSRRDFPRAGAAGRPLCATARAERVRPRHHAPGAALSGRSGTRDRGGGAAAAARRATADRRFRATRARVPARRARACASRLFRSPDRGLADGNGPGTHGQARFRPTRGGRPRPHRQAVAGAGPAPADRRAGRDKSKCGDRVVNQFRLSRRPDIGSRIRVSFEFFPPKTDDAETRLWETIKRLEPLAPKFVSVTYGAGGSTRERTARTVTRIHNETSLTPAAHLTCVDASRDEVEAVIAELVGRGIRNFVALRGDPAEGVGACYRPHPDGYANGAELVAALSRAGDFDASGSAYPEKHPESPDFATDIDMLKRKVDNGATRAITQFFFDNDLYERYVERVRRAGIFVPIVPGILPIHNFAQVANFASRCGAHVP